jgi:hypothetical protein
MLRQYLSHISRKINYITSGKNVKKKEVRCPYRSYVHERMEKEI